MPLRSRWAAAGALVAAAFAAACSDDAPPPSSSPSASARRDSAAFIAAVDGLAADARRRGPIAGLSIAVFERDQAVLARGYGEADLEAGVAATASTSYPIASVSKMFTAAAILRLAEQGKLSLEDPLSRFFPEARAPIGVLRIRHLLEHTSGLTRGGQAPRSAALSVISRGGTRRPQGEEWDYSNYNFSLLGLVLEQASGLDYARYVSDELAGPLRLTGTGYCEDGRPVPGRGHDYQSGIKALSPTPYWTQAPFFASGGLCSTVLDLVRWQEALDGGRVVSPVLLQAMRTPARLPNGLEVGYGFGTRLGFTGRHRKIGHTGGGQSNKAVLARYPDEDVTIAVLLNTERDNAPVTAVELEDRIARLFFGVDEPSLGAPPLVERDLSRYTGEYRDGVRAVHIALQDGMLTMRPGLRHGRDSRLWTEDGQVFFDAADSSLEVRFQIRDGRPIGYTRYYNGWFVGLGAR